jgi:hypothetical protein
MRRDVLRRVRWANVSLACAVLIALTTVVIWPLVSPAPPALPPDAPRPLVAPEPREGTPARASGEKRERESGGAGGEKRGSGGARREKRGSEGAAREKGGSGGAAREKGGGGTGRGGADRRSRRAPAKTRAASPRRTATPAPPAQGPRATATPAPSVSPPARTVAPEAPVVTPRRRSAGGGEFGFEGAR